MIATAPYLVFTAVIDVEQDAALVDPLAGPPASSSLAQPIGHLGYPVVSQCYLLQVLLFHCCLLRLIFLLSWLLIFLTCCAYNNTDCFSKLMLVRLL